MALENALTIDDIKQQSGAFKSVFMYRVCGTGMGACACLLKQAGLHVVGADNRFEPPMSTYLKESKIELHDLSVVTTEFLQQFDLVVVGNVVPKNSEDAQKIENSGVPFCSFPAALGGLFLNKQNVVGIAGTHGKTTTTYFFTQVFERLGFKPGYFIGGVIDGAPSSRLGDGSYFFIESDEYDSSYFEKVSKFRMYELDHMILTSLEFDHADIFENVSQIQDQFRPVLESLGGSLIYDETYNAATELVETLTQKKMRKITTYAGLDQGPLIVEEGPQGTVFNLMYSNELKTFETNLIGAHNILNLSSCLLFCDDEGISYEAVAPLLKDLKHVRRRQQVRGLYGKAQVIDDFAHHPRAVELTLSGLRTKYPDKKMTVVFEPNSATARSSLFQNEFTKAFSIADKLIITVPARATSVKFAENLDIKAIVSDLERHGRQAATVANLEELLVGLEDSKSDEDLIVVLSNGTCLGFWESEIAKTFN